MQPTSSTNATRTKAGLACLSPIISGLTTFRANLICGRQKVFFFFDALLDRAALLPATTSSLLLFSVDALTSVCLYVRLALIASTKGRRRSNRK